MRSLLPIALLVVALPVALAACGNKGPLVKPSDIPAAPVPAEPAPASDETIVPPADAVPPPADPEDATPPAPPTPGAGNG